MNEDIVLARMLADKKRTAFRTSAGLLVIAGGCAVFLIIPALIIIAGVITLVWADWFFLRFRINTGRFGDSEADLRKLSAWMEENGAKKTNIDRID